MSRDIVGENGGENIYAAFRSDPINKQDALGLLVLDYFEEEPDLSIELPDRDFPPNDFGDITKLGTFKEKSFKMSWIVQKKNEQCRIHDIRISAWVQIRVRFGKADAPTNDKSVTVFQHEKRHQLNYSIYILTLAGALRSHEDIWECCPCTAIRENLMYAIQDELITRRKMSDIFLDILHYPPKYRKMLNQRFVFYKAMLEHDIAYKDGLMRLLEKCR